MKDYNKIKNIPLSIGHFTGNLIDAEYIEDDGLLSSAAAYFLYNNLTQQVLAGICGDIQAAEKQMQDKVKAYMIEHPDEAKELIKNKE